MEVGGRREGGVREEGGWGKGGCGRREGGRVRAVGSKRLLRMCRAVCVVYSVYGK